ncbi:hypothetical protein MCOR29_010644 [Pyricularia oryzae]|nr:hypothetical protein MCOR19_006283 [Pyricularia oryzae]KAI6304679.1 hypothetical protein MCOR29_010644 [Pyricularia oryzae]KAI6486790.1 hypothetical protein MCOR18_003324 [Pyricularia oryzae]
MSTRQTTLASVVFGLLVFYPILVSSQAVPPPGPTQPGTAPNCNKWHIVISGSGDNCDNVAARYKITLAQFLKWNPAVSSDCLQFFWPDYAYCVSVDASITAVPTTSTSVRTTFATRTTSAVSTSVLPPVSTPSYTFNHPVTDLNITTPTVPTEEWPPKNTQAGQPSYCNDWHLVMPGESCRAIVLQHGSWMGIEDFFLWNPAVGSDCMGLSLYKYVCVGIQPQTQISIDFPTITNNATVPPMVIPTAVELPPVDNSFAPSPAQGPLPTDCVEYYLTQPGETCRDVVAKHDSITQAQFLAWHPFLNGNCDGLWLGYYYCILVENFIPEPPVETSAPSPVEAGIVSDCRAWFKATGPTWTCEQFVLIFGRFSLSDFIKWNPAVGSSCENSIKADYWYCVAVPDTPTTRTATLPGVTSTATVVPPTSTTASPPPATPTPTQPGMISGCRKFYFVQSGDVCWAIANSAGIELTDFYKWNPGVEECGKLWPEYYVCVGI